MSGNSGDSGKTGSVDATLGAINTAIRGNANIGGVDVSSGDSGETGDTGNAHAVGAAQSIANSGALSSANSLSGNTGSAANDVRATVVGGNGGAGGDNARVRSDRAGDAVARQSIRGRNNRVSLGASLEPA